MNEASASVSTIRQRLQRIRTLVRRGLPFVSGVFAAVLALLIYNALVPPPPPLTTRDVDNSIAQALASATPRPAFSADAYQIIQPSLVFINTQAAGPTQTNTDYHPPQNAPAVSLVRWQAPPTNGNVGAGVIVNDAGVILTSLHVVRGAGSIRLTYADGSHANAQVVGAQPENDIAVLSADQLPNIFVPATLANPNAMRVGDEAFVVGTPYGLAGSMSAGVISGFERTFQLPHTDLVLQHLIQFDAAVNPGNAGGPLLNRDGAVVGIVTTFLNPTGQDVFAGIGFAVPITTAGGAAGAPPV